MCVGVCVYVSVGGHSADAREFVSECVYVFGDGVCACDCALDRRVVRTIPTCVCVCVRLRAV